VALFERGMQRLQRHDYEEAADDFRTLLATYPTEAALRERSAVYLALCDRELARRPADPRTLEERLTAATAALNDGDDERAGRLARTVLDEAPQHDLALYLLAAVAARRGAAVEALDLLRQALRANPEIRAQARHDADFEELRDLDDFRDLIDSPAAGPDGFRSLRRPRR
jgi:Tfp pilus assembly protein PilF